MRKLEIGPGTQGRTPDGDNLVHWDTVDSVPGAMYRARWGYDSLPIAEQSYDWVHASHVLEHVPWWLTRSALQEVYRVLRPGGRFSVWVPDVVRLFKEYLDNPQAYAKRERGWPCGGLNERQDPWTYLNARVFWGARPGERGQEQHFHRAMFGEPQLEALLRQGGFEHVQRIRRNVAVDPGHGWMELGMEGYR